MKHFLLNLTDDDGVVIERWKIGVEREYDIEDLDAEPECNFYIDDALEIGREVCVAINQTILRGN